MSDSECQRSFDDERLIVRAAEGDHVALAELFGRYRKRLRQMVRLRLDRRLQGRVDPSDVLQEAYLDVAAATAPLPGQARDAFLPLAAAGGRSAVDADSSRAPGGGHAGRRPRGLALQGGLAAGQLGLAGGPTAGPVYGGQPGGLPGRGSASDPGRPQQHGADRSRNHRLAALRGVDQRRGSRGPGPGQIGGQQAVHPGPQAATSHARARSRPVRAAR